MVWRHLDFVVNADNNEAVGYVKCKTWGSDERWQQEDWDFSLSVTRGQGGGMQQTTMTGFTTTYWKKITQQAKAKIIERCIAYCYKDIRPFRFIAGEGFVELAY